MNAIMEWISQLELSTIHIVSIVILFLYILLSGIGISLIYAAGRGYMDLARGLRRILERQESNDQLDDIDELSGEIQKYYDSYCKLNPAVSQRYSGIIGWMDDILLQTNMFSNSTKKKKKITAFGSMSIMIPFCWCSKSMNRNFHITVAHPAKVRSLRTLLP